MVTDAELEKLNRLAAREDLPLATIAYQLLAYGLRRRK
jgi:hypothetical protein